MKTEPTRAITPRSSRVRPTRAEKSARTLDALVRAAETVIGQKGYDGASVAMIAIEAKVAAGTFYNYFESRQDLFDKLLPAIGREMLEYIQVRSRDGKTELEREEKRLRAFFSFLEVRPGFYRILYEAEVFAPEAFRAHIDTVAKGYTRLLSRARSEGQLINYTDEELEIVGMMLVGIRHYLCMNYARSDGRTFQPPDSVIHAYIRLIRDGITIGSPKDSGTGRTMDRQGL